MRTLDLLHISLADQRLYGFADGQLLLRLLVSTAANGAGERNGSGCTPRGLHQVRAKIGDGLPCAAVLRGRRWTGEVWTPQLHEQFPERDWILSRILWLSGCELGCNRLGDLDSFRRYIYVHGTPDCEPMGEPRSHGCVRMRNADLLELFPRVPLHCAVRIDEAPCPLWAAASLG
jgi:lipoprotein-anchoring transpeptidase ErfK/SrfK